MSRKNRVTKLETKLSSSTNKELIELLNRLKSENGNNSLTPKNLELAACLRQIAVFLPA